MVGEEREGVVGEEREGVVEEEREGVVEEEREGVVGEEREGVVEGKEREGVVEGKERGRKGEGALSYHPSPPKSREFVCRPARAQSHYSMESLIQDSDGICAPFLSLFRRCNQSACVGVFDKKSRT